MENNYHFKINQKTPSDEQIAQHMDFDALLKKHQSQKAAPKRKPQVRRLVYWGSAAAAAIALLIFALPSLKPTPKPIDANTFFAQKEAITSPLANQKDISSFYSSKINVNQGGVYEYESGSRLVIPSSAFVDDRGKLVEGDVTIYYKEYVDNVDFFLSGIPLQYNNGNKSALLEPNGMVEVFAQKNGQLVSLAPGKKIQIELVGHMFVPYDANISTYGIYQFDSLQRNWNYVTVDNIQYVEDVNVELDDPLYQLYKNHQFALSTIDTKEKTAIAAIDNSIPFPVAPIKPQPRDKNRPTLELSFLKDVLDQKGVDKNLYMETIWQISAKSPAFDERAFQVVWEDADIKNINDSEYELTLISGDNILHLIVNPVLTSNEFSQALTLYQTKLSEYQEKINNREATLVEQKRALNNLYQKERQTETKLYKKEFATISKKDGSSTPFMVRSVLNLFETNQLGIFACATPRVIQQNSLIADFSLENNKALNPQVAFVHFKNSNVIQRILAQDGMNIHFALNDIIEIWMIDEDGNLLTSNPVSPTLKTKSHTFSMKQKGKVSNRQEVQRYLKAL